MPASSIIIERVLMCPTYIEIAEGFPPVSGQATTFKVPCSDLHTTDIARLPDLTKTYPENAEKKDGKLQKKI